MSRCFIGVGSNVGDRTRHLETAAQLLWKLNPGGGLRASSVYETPALLPDGAPADWDRPFLNAVLECEWPGTATDLLSALKAIETQMGRTATDRWAPRPIDLDVLLFGSEEINEPSLQIPHAGIWDRAFVLCPLRDLAPSLKIPGRSIDVRTRAHQVAGHMPLWMGILNLTPDSFSDGGSLSDAEKIVEKVEEFERCGVGYLDLGGESTRPGATAVTPDVEWQRIRDALSFLTHRYRDRVFRPRLSVDTRSFQVAALALESGADMINDVSGGADPKLVQLVAARRRDYVFMHSLSVPADRRVNLPEEADVVSVIHAWAERKLEELDKMGVSLDRVLFDPGIGFGKLTRQSLEICRHIDAFFDLPVRLMVGHSRKSFLTAWGERTAADREWEGVGVSLALAGKGVDVLRVHAPDQHRRALRTFMEVQACRL